MAVGDLNRVVSLMLHLYTCQAIQHGCKKQPLLDWYAAKDFFLLVTGKLSSLVHR